jgi:hypothetical protein
VVAMPGDFRHAVPRFASLLRNGYGLRWKPKTLSYLKLRQVRVPAFQGLLEKQLIS